MDRPACKILYDFHQQITEGNLISNFDRTWDEIAYLRVGNNPGRDELTTGEINFRNAFKRVNEKEYGGVMGMEHWMSGEGKSGKPAVIGASACVDSFNTPSCS